MKTDRKICFGLTIIATAIGVEAYKNGWLPATTQSIQNCEAKLSHSFNVDSAYRQGINQAVGNLGGLPDGVEVPETPKLEEPSSEWSGEVLAACKKNLSKQEEVNRSLKTTLSQINIAQGSK